MKTEEITPWWVVKNFLSDYENRHGSFMRDWNKEWGHDPSPANHDLWFERMFPEALSELLKAQREACAGNSKIQRIVVGHNGTNNEFGYIVDRESIINAPIPEPKNRK